MAVNVGRARPVAVLAAMTACGLLAGGCGSSGSSGGSSASSAPATASAPGSTSSASLGTPHPATGSPVVFGLLNLLSGPVTFPEVSEGEQAAAQQPLARPRQGREGRRQRHSAAWQRRRQGGAAVE